MKGQVTYVNEGIAGFLNSFYAISDTPGNHETYASQFTKDALFVMAGKRNTGYDEILAMRKSMWNVVVARDHTVFQVYPSTTDPKEFMLEGSVNYELKDGSKQMVDWAGHAKVVKSEGGQWQFEQYQVYLAGGPVASK
jgi:hypothetical protein